MSDILIDIRNLTRFYQTGEEKVFALHNVDLQIRKGEMVAIVGASGSGKSTLMNILGCLDSPTSGSYAVSGRETSAMTPDELAALRREHFGFIFQRYHLLPELDGVGNVEIPAIYAGTKPEARKARATALLERLGMEQRLHHRPGQLSGGQQQRVSIARALMNGGEAILADEPTGALDSRSGEEVLLILKELHAEGKTIVIVTHDMNVAKRAERIIEMKDGVIVSDRAVEPEGEAPAALPKTRDEKRSSSVGLWRSRWDRFQESFMMALLSMKTHRLRSFLTMLGIIIGIASVVCVVALGEGSRQKVLANISSLGANTLEIFPGRDYGDVRSGRIRTLVLSDADALARQPYAAAVTPTVSTSATVRYGSKESNALINGVSEQYFDVKGLSLSAGSFFGADAVSAMAQDVVIDENTRKTLFNADEDPVGKVIFAGAQPARIIGVIKPQQGGFGSSSNLSLYMPYSTVQVRYIGNNILRSITLRVSDDISTSLAEQAATQLLTQRHGTVDFFILNTDDIRRTITATTETLTLLIASIAVISLIVGGIGVMNIMLVSVSERVSEIGVRMAVGARRSDILLQFLIEAVLVCLIGGLIGILLALGFGVAFAASGAEFSLIYSPTSIIAAFLCSSLIGIVFGYLPAKGASKLDPATALTRD